MTDRAMRLSTRRRLPGSDGNYQVVLQAMIDSGEIPMVPGVQQVQVAHDDWCAIWRGGRCDCNPDVEVAIAGRNEAE